MTEAETENEQSASTSIVVASVIIRAKDEERDIGRTLSALASQTIASAVETIVVDSGSSDSTVEIVRGFGIEPIEIAASRFTYGGALNIGCAEARGEVLIALSAHAVPTRSDWLERMIEPFADSQIACVCGYAHGPDGEALRTKLIQDAALAEARPHWGYTNGSGAFRSELWRERPFREDMPGTEDKEWAWYWLWRGWLSLVDPALAVEHDHEHEGLRTTYRRARREAHGIGMFAPVVPETVPELVRRWWNEKDGRPSHLRARLSPSRAVHLVGGWRGQRAADRWRRQAPQPP